MAGGYSVVISATDAASGVLDGVNKRVEALNKRVALAAAPFKRLHENLDKFARVTGLDRIATGFKDVGEAAGHAWRGLSRVLEPLAAIVGAASLAGIYKLASAWGDFATQLGIQAQRAGVSADSLFALQNAAKLAGVSADALTGGLTALTDNLRNAAFGGAPEFLQVLDKLHVSYAELKKQSPERQVETLARALGGVRNVTDRALYTKELFGGEGMIPFLNRGADGIQQLLDKARQLNGGILPAGLKALQDFRTAQEGLAQSFGSVGRAIAETLAPVLTPLLDQLSGAAVQTRQWLEANQAWLRSTISEEIGRVVTALKGFDWAGLGQAMKTIAERADGVAQSLGGWERVGEGVALFFGGRFLVQMLLPFLQLGLVAGRIGLAVSGYLIEAFVKAGGAEIVFGEQTVAVMMKTVLPAVTSVVTAVGTSLVAAFQAAGVALNVFSRAALANPVFRAMAIAFGLYDQISKAVAPADPGPDDVRRSLLGEPAVQPSRDNPLGQRDWRPSWLGGAPDVKPIPLAERKRNALDIAGVLEKEGGLTREGAAALVGGGIQESGLNPQAGQGRAHQGIFQWSNERRAAVEKQFNKPLMQMTPQEQARAALWELQTKPEFRGIYQTLRTSHDIDVTNDVATRRFEAPGNYDVEVPHRLGLSKGVLADLPQGDPAPLPAGQQGAPGASGKVDVNVRVSGQPAAVTAQSRGDVGLNIAAPGLLGVP